MNKKQVVGLCIAGAGNVVGAVLLKAMNGRNNRTIDYAREVEHERDVLMARLEKARDRNETKSRVSSMFWDDDMVTYIRGLYPKAKVDAYWEAQSKIVNRELEGDSKEALDYIIETKDIRKKVMDVQWMRTEVSYGRKDYDALAKYQEAVNDLNRDLDNVEREISKYKLSV